MEPTDIDWKCTKLSLRGLEKMLTCALCNNLLKQPCTLGGCEHFFCGSCAEAVVDKSCPVCGIPSHVKDIQTNRELKTTVSLCRRLRRLLNSPNDVNEPGGNEPIVIDDEEEEAAAETTEEARRAGAFDFTDSPADSPRALRANRRRKNKNRDAEKNQQNHGDHLTSEEQQILQRKAAKSSSNHVDDTSSDKENSDVEIVSETKASKKSRQSSRTQRQTKSWPDSGKPKGGARSRSPLVQQMEKSPGESTSGYVSQGSTPATPLGRRSQEQLVSRSPIVALRRVSAPSAAKQTRRASEGSPRFSTPTANRSRGHGASSRVSTPNNRQGFSRKADTPAFLKKNAKGETPLQVAVIKGDYDRVEQLLKEGAPTNVKDNAGWTPLASSCAARHLRFIGTAALLFNRETCPHRKVFLFVQHEACHYGFVGIATLLLDHGALINIPGCDNETPLHDAISHNRVDVVRLLVSRGASLTDRNLHGRTALDLALRGSDAMREALETPIANTQALNTATEVPEELEIHQVVLLATGLKREQKRKLDQLALILHGKCLDEFSSEVTHLVAETNAENLCARTSKYLKCVVTGKWIVNFDWVEHCIELRRRVTEEAFAVPSCSPSPEGRGPERGRANRLHQFPGLFDGCRFFLKGTWEHEDLRHDVLSLVQLGGGQILTREPRQDNVEETHVVPYHAAPRSSLAHCNHYVVVSSKDAAARRVGPRLCQVPASWVIDSAARFELVDLFESNSA